MKSRPQKSMAAVPAGDTKSRIERFLTAGLVLLLLSGCSQKIDTHREFVEVAYQHERSGRLPEAVKAYQKALELNSKSASTWYDLGVAFAAMEQFPDAIDAYSKAISLDATMDRAFNNRAAAYAALKQLDNAVEDCNRAIELRSDDYLSWRNRGLAYHDLGKPEKALADYDESIRLNGRSAATYLYRGNVYLEKELWQRALEDFEHAVHLDDQLSSAWHSRAKALARLGRNDEAGESSKIAKNLGADVSDVFDFSSETAPAAVRRQADAAVEFVKEWLKNQNVAAADSDSPWDLQGTAPGDQKRYIVKEISSSGNTESILFTDSVLRQIESTADVVPCLIVVEKLSSTSLAGDGNTAFRVLKNIEGWRPDFSAMKPVSWLLPMSSESSDEPPETGAADPE